MNKTAKMNRKSDKLFDLLNLKEFKLIDIGAAGDLDRRWKILGERLSVTGFEPGRDEYEKLIKGNNNKNLKYHNCCVAKEASDLKYFVCQKATSSSCFEPNHEFLRRFPDSERFSVKQEMSLPADSLDNVVGSEKFDFIKIDTQGSELDILKGSRQALENVCGLEVEVEFSPHYKEQPLFSEVDSYLRGAGFSLFDLRPCYWKRSHSQSKGRGQISFADALYFKDYLMLGAVPEFIAPVIVAAVLYQKYSFACELAEYFHQKGKLNSEEAKNIELSISKLSEPFFRIPDFRGRMKIISYLERALGLLKSAHWARYESWK